MTDHDNGSGLQAPETADQRWERLTETIWSYFNDGTPTSTCRAIADAIIASDRTAGCNPDVLRALIDLEQREKRDLQYERDEARAEIDKKNVVIRNYRARVSQLVNDKPHVHMVERRITASEERVEKAEADRDALAARLAVVTAALEAIRGWARATVVIPGDGRSVLLGDITRLVDRTLTDIPARAAAMLRVVEAAHHVTLTGEGADELRRALHALTDIPAMTEIDLKELRRLAEAAVDDTGCGIQAEYSGASRPSTILALLDRLERAESERDSLITAICGYPDHPEMVLTADDALRAHAEERSSHRQATDGISSLIGQRNAAYRAIAWGVSRKDDPCPSDIPDTIAAAIGFAKDASHG